MTGINAHGRTVREAVLPLHGGRTRMDSLFWCAPIVLFTAILLIA